MYLFRNILRKNINKYLIHTILTSPEPPQPSQHQSQQASDVAMQMEDVLLGTASEPLLDQLLLPDSDTVPPASNNPMTVPNLHVVNHAQVDGNLFYAHAFKLSDQRLKENIVSDKTDALHQLRQLRPCVYNLVSSPSKDPEVGYLAQQVQSVLPEAVVGDAASGLLALRLDVLLVRAIEAINQLYDTQQEQSAEIKAEMKALKAQDDAQCLGMQVLQWVLRHSDQLACGTEDSPDPANAHDSQQHIAESSIASDCSNAVSVGVRNEATMPSVTGSVHSVPFGGKTDPGDITQYLMSAMNETSVFLCAKFTKGLSIVGPDAMWECYQAACKEDGKLYKTFLLQMERRKRDVRSRYADAKLL